MQEKQPNLIIENWELYQFYSVAIIMLVHLPREFTFMFNVWTYFYIIKWKKSTFTTFYMYTIYVKYHEIIKCYSFFFFYNRVIIGYTSKFKFVN